MPRGKSHNREEVDDATAARRDPSFYAVLVLVLPIWGVVPASWVYALYCTFIGCPRSLERQALLIYAWIEVVFSVYYWYLEIKVGARKSRPNVNMGELRKTLDRIRRYGLRKATQIMEPEGEDLGGEQGLEQLEQLEWDDPRAVEYREVLRKWLNNPYTSVSLDDLREWAYWFVFNAPMPPEGELLPEQKEILYETLELIMKRAGGPPSSPEDTILGSTRKRIKKILTLTIDPFTSAQRPLAWYVFVKVTSKAQLWWLESSYELKHGTFGSIEYLFRIPKCHPDSSVRPTLFFHGLGLGIWQHFYFLKRLFDSNPKQPFLMLLQPQTSQDFFHSSYLDPPRAEQTAADLIRLLKKLGWVDEGVAGVEGGGRGVTVLSQSNGSFLHGHLLKHHPSVVSRSCFVDPVVFCIFEGDVCANFVYKPPTDGVELLIRYFAASELGVSTLLRRHFNWVEGALWFEDIPGGKEKRTAMYVLSGRDTILNVDRTRRYLEENGVTDGLWVYQNALHGQACILPGAGMDTILKWICNP